MKILCVGDLNGDLIVPYGKAKEGKELVQVSFRVGGTVGNTVSYLGKLNDHPYFVGDLCGDSIGKELQENVKENGVDLSYAKEGNNKSLLCVAVIDEKGERLILPWLPKGSSFLKLREESFSLVPKEDFYIFSSGMVLTNEEETMKSVLAFFKEMKEETNSKLIFDFNVRKESYGLEEKRKFYYDEILSLCDVILGSKEEWDFFNIEELGKEKVCVCHDGKEDVVVIDHGERNILKVEPLAVKHSVGAGDVFNAGVLDGFYKDKSVLDAVKQGILEARAYLIEQNN